MEFLPPELSARFWSISQLTSDVAVPEAPMNQDDCSPSPEDNIRTTWKTADMKAVSKPQSVEKRPDNDFGLGVLCPNLGHIPTSPLGRYTVCHVFITSQVYFSRSWRSAEPVMGGPRCLPVGTALSVAPEIRSYQEMSEVGLPHELSVSCTGGGQGE
jgi:hypothetical protein